MSSFHDNPLYDEKIEELLNNNSSNENRIIKNLSKSSFSSSLSSPSPLDNSDRRSIPIISSVNDRNSIFPNYSSLKDNKLNEFQIGNDILDKESFITMQELKNGLLLISPESFRDADIDKLLDGVDSDESDDLHPNSNRKLSIEDDISLLSGMDSAMDGITFSDTLNESANLEEVSSSASGIKTSNDSTRSDDDTNNDEDDSIHVDEQVDTILNENNHSTSSFELTENINENKKDDILFDNYAPEEFSLTTISNITEISSNLIKYSSHVGKVTCIKKYDKSIIVGTTKGAILVYNLVQRPFMLQFPSKTQDYKYKYPSVVCIDVFDNYLISSYSNGNIILWDLTSRSYLQKITDLLSSAPTNLIFLSDWNDIIIGDQKKILKIKVNRKLFRRSIDTELIYESENCSIFTISLISHRKVSNQNNYYTIIAFATQKNFIVQCLEPRIIDPIIFLNREDFINQQSISTLPIIDWCNSNSKKESERDQKSIKDPLVCIAWGKKIKFFHITFIENIESICFCELELKFDIKILNWVDDRIVIIVDIRNNIIIVDPFSSHYLFSSQLDLTLVHHSFFDHSVSTMNQKNEMRHVLSKLPSYHFSSSKEGLSVYLIAIEGIFVLNLKTWKERLEELLEKKEFERFFNLGLSMFRNDKESIGTIGLPKELSKAQNELSSFLLNHIIDYFTGLIDNLELSSKALDLETYKLIKMTIHLDREDAVYKHFYEILKKIEKENTFLNIIEKLILEGEIKQVPKSILDTMIKNYVENDDIETLDEILLKVNTQMIDLPNLVSHCQEKQKYKTLLYAYASRQQYINAMHALLKVAFDHQNELNQNFNEAIKLLFEYLSETLQGHSYPRGRIGVPHRQLKELKLQIIFELLTDFSNLGKLFIVLFNSNFKLFVKLMTQLFSDSTPTNPWKESKSPEILKDNINISLEDLLLQIQAQSVSRVDVLFYMMNELHLFENDPTAPWLVKNPVEIAYFFIFVNTISASGKIFLSDSVLLRCIVMITYNLGYEPEEKLFIQNEIVESLKQLNLIDNIEKQIIGFCETAGFHIVCVYLYEKRGEFSKVLFSYLKDENLKDNVFMCIILMFKNEKDESSIRELKNAIINQLSTLINLDSTKTAKIIIDYLYEEHDKVVNLLDSFPKTQYEYLKAILGPNSYNIELQLKKNGIWISLNLRMKYLELMCQFEPDKVANQLSSDLKNYPIEYSFNLCKKYGIMDAAAFLLDSGGDTFGAIDLYMEDISKKLSILKSFLLEKAFIEDPNNENFLKYRIYDFFSEEPSQLNRNEKKVLPLIDSVNILKLTQTKKILKSIYKLLDILSNAVSDRKPVTEIKKKWLEILNIFLEKLRKIHIEYDGKNRLKKSNSDEINFDSDSDISDDEDNSDTLQLLINRKNKIYNDLLIYESNFEKKIQFDQEYNQILEEIDKYQNKQNKNINKLSLLWMYAVVRNCFIISYEKMIEYISVEEFLQYVSLKWKQEEIGFARYVISDALKKISYSLNLHESIINITKEELFKLGKEMINYSRKYIYSNSICTICNQPIQKSKSILFSCGHIYHNNCAKFHENVPYCIIHDNNSLILFRQNQDITSSLDLNSEKNETENQLVSKYQKIKESESRTEDQIVRELFLGIGNTYFKTDIYGNPRSTTQYNLSTRNYNRNIELKIKQLPGINIGDYGDDTDDSDSYNSDDNIDTEDINNSDERTLKSNKKRNNQMNSSSSFNTSESDSSDEINNKYRNVSKTHVASHSSSSSETSYEGKSHLKSSSSLTSNHYQHESDIDEDSSFSDDS